MKRIILFARVSTQQQSMESQIKELKDEASRQGYSDENQLLIEMKESAVTLDTEERQGIRMLKDAITSDSTIDSVVIHEISRLSRRPKVLYEVRDWLIERHINLICLKPYMQMLDENGQMSQTANLLFSLFGSMAESEGYIRKERMARGKRAKKAAGGYIGGTPLWGYVVDKSGKVVADESTKPIIRRIYNMYEQGMSFGTIGQWLIDTGLYCGNLGAAARRVGSVVSRSEYAGICENDTYPYEQIVTPEQYERCRAIRCNKSKEHTRLKSLALCKGLLYSKSGHLLSPNINKQQYKLCLIDKSENMTVKFSLIDTFIWDKAIEQAKQQSKIGINNRVIECEQIRRDAKDSTARYNDIIKDLEGQIDRLQRRIIEGKIAEVRGDQLIAELEEKLNNATEERNNWMRRGGKAAVELELLSYGIYDQAMDLANMNELERHNFVRQYIDKVVFEKSGIKRGHYKMTIYYRYNEPTTHFLWSSGPWNKID